MDATIPTPTVKTLLPEQAKTEITLGLTKAEIFLNTLSEAARAMVVTEDNLDDAKELLNKIVKARTTIEDIHKKVKKPYLDSGRACDEAKSALIENVSAIETPLRTRYNKVCTEVEDRQRKEREEEERKNAIRSGIEANIQEFAQRVAQCADLQSVLEVERKINLHKVSPTTKHKYAEFYDEAIARFDQVLMPVLRDQKIKLKDLVVLKKTIAEAEANADIDKLDELNVQKENLEHGIHFNQEDVQEKALMSSTTPAASLVIPTKIPKGGRTEYEAEIVDIDVAFKKSKHLLKIELKTAEAKNIAKTLDDAGSLKEGSVIVNGIKYTKVKRY